MEVWIFGNEDYRPDSLPLKIQPTLKKLFPQINFIVQDPNENWQLPNKLFIIDTVAGIKDVTTFDSLDNFINSQSLTTHDFDLALKLQWLNKLKKLPPFLIIGIPMKITKATALKKIKVILKRLINGI